MEESEELDMRIEKYSKKVEAKQEQIKEIENLLANRIEVVPLGDLEAQVQEMRNRVAKLQNEVDTMKEHSGAQSKEVS